MRYIAAVLIIGIGIMAGCGTTTDSTESTAINLLPSSAQVTVGDSVYFYALVANSDSTFEQVAATFSISGNIGSISSSGIFTAEVEGTGTIVAIYEDVSATSAVTVVSGDTSGIISTIEVTASSTTGRVGETLVFTAEAWNSSGEALSFNPVWAISGDSIGTFTYSADIASLEVLAEGSAVITCTSDEVTATTYITIEGYVIEITAEADTYVHQEASDESYGSASSLIGGTDASTGTYEAYIKFNISSIPSGSTIDSGTISLYSTDTDGAEMQIKRIGTTWEGTTTWNTRPTLEGFIATCAFAYGANFFDVGDALQYWVDYGNNYGIALLKKDISTTGYAVMISRDDLTVESRRPKLRIEYSLP